MAKTQVKGSQVADGTVGRTDLDSTTVGNAVVKKLVQGSNITLSATGADAGTGDVTISAPLTTGPQGPTGATGPGVPVGGVLGAILHKKSATDFDTEWKPLASLQTAALSPTGITSVGTSVMLGMGSTAKITPTGTGKILVIIAGSVFHNTAAGRCNSGMNYGTVAGGVPVNGGALAGTAFGANSAFQSSTANQMGPLVLVGILTGLTVGTQYWIDVAMNLTNAGTGTALLVGISAVELP